MTSTTATKTGIPVNKLSARPLGWDGVQARMRYLCFCTVLITLSVANRGAAQCLSVPPAYSATCTEMQGYISTFNTTLSSQWSNVKGTTAFGTELLFANSNISLAGILAPEALSKVQLELDGLQKVGVQFVTIGVSFPILYQPFYDNQNAPSQDYALVLSFYQGVMAAVRQHGMKVLIETTVVFPDYAPDLPLLPAYYATLSSSQFNAARAQTAQNVAQLLQPDWMNLGSEPDTISELIGLSSEYAPQEWATQISTIVTQLRGAGINGKPLIGAGCGSWQQNGSDYVQALMPTGIDYFDLHTFSVNLPAAGTVPFLNDAVTFVNMAIAAGKGAAISETWDHKLTDAQLQGKTEFGIINLLADTEAYNAYSFWAPQDAEYLGAVIDLAYWKQLLYVSPFESELFFANMNYNLTSSLTTAQLTVQETQAESAALNAGTLSPLGQWYAAAIKPVNAVTISAAWNTGAGGLAPGSLVSIYGDKLAATSATAASLPLPTTLAGIGASITDASGVQTPLPLFYAGPSQINAEIPESASLGPAVITINTPTGPVGSPVVLNPVAPAVFVANQSGTGVAAAILVTNQSDGSQTAAEIFNSPCAAGSCVGIPLDVSAGESALELFGTGIQNRASLSDVTVMIGGQTLAAAYAGPAPGFTGLDQVNVLLPPSLAGSGTVNITVSVAGAASNVVTATFQ